MGWKTHTHMTHPKKPSVRERKRERASTTGKWREELFVHFRFHVFGSKAFGVIFISLSLLLTFALKTGAGWMHNKLSSLFSVRFSLQLKSLDCAAFCLTSFICRTNKDFPPFFTQSFPMIEPLILPATSFSLLSLLRCILFPAAAVFPSLGQFQGIATFFCIIWPLVRNKHRSFVISGWNMSQIACTQWNTCI